MAEGISEDAQGGHGDGSTDRYGCENFDDHRLRRVGLLYTITGVSST
jgi:hypothetical protein